MTSAADRAADPDSVSSSNARLRPVVSCGMTSARRTHGFRESVIRGMTRLASEHQSINLAQGFPNFAAPDLLKAAAAEAVQGDINQYAITWGAQRLREALARKYRAWYGLDDRPRTRDHGHLRRHRSDDRDACSRW